MITTFSVQERDFQRLSSDIPIDLDYADPIVRPSEYRSSCATVLMLDCSHSIDPIVKARAGEWRAHPFVHRDCGKSPRDRLKCHRDRVSGSS